MQPFPVIRYACQGLRAALPLLALAGIRPALAQTAAAVQQATGVSAGLCVHVGATDGTLEAGLASVNLAVQGITIGDPGPARAAIQAKGLYGFATVQKVKGYAPLPYANNLVNLVVADLDALGAQAPSADEINRVLSPFGMSYLKKGGQWVKSDPKPLAPGMDEWTHHGHNADGNAASSDTALRPINMVRWVSGPEGAYSAVKTMVTAGGKVFHSTYGWQKPNLVVARNAFNGIKLWQTATATEFREDMRLFTGGGRVYRSAPAKDGGWLEGLDINTGKRLVLFTHGIVPDSIRRGPRVDPWWINEGGAWEVYHQERVLQSWGDSIVAMDAATGDVAWRFKVPGAFGDRILAGDGRVYWFVNQTNVRGPDCYDQTPDPLKEIICFNAADGKVLWRNADAAGKYLSYIAYGNGCVVGGHYLANLGPGWAGGQSQDIVDRNFLISIRGEDGHTNFTRSSFTFAQYQRSMNMRLAVMNNAIYYVANGFAAGYDLLTGKDILNNCMAIGNEQYECLIYRATPKFFLNNWHKFTDLSGKHVDATGPITRPTCWSSYTPAYGMLYSGADFQTSNFGYHLTTNTGLAYEDTSAYLDDSKRLEPGEVAVAPVAVPAWPAADEWPIYRGNGARSAYTPGAVPKSIHKVWQVRIDAPNRAAGPVAEDYNENAWGPGMVSAPTVAGGLVFVSVCDANRVDAYQAADGSKAWSFTAGGRLDGPPTIYGGMCLFGAKDGYVYGLQASTGKLAWRFLAAPYERDMVAFGQVESTHPVRASVLVQGGALWAVAGRHGNIQPGLQLYKLNPFTGQLLWHRSLAPKELNELIPGLLQTDGTVINLGYTAIDPANPLVAPMTNLDKGAPQANLGAGSSVPAGYRVRVISPITFDKTYSFGWIHNPNTSGYLTYTGSPKGDWNATNCLASGNGKVAGASYYYHDDVRGGLSVYRLAPSGDVDTTASQFTVKTDDSRVRKTFTGLDVQATTHLLMAGDQLVVGGQGSQNYKPFAFVDIYGADGSKLGGDTVAGTRFIPDGMAAAGGHLYATTEDGRLVAFGDMGEKVAIKARPRAAGQAARGNLNATQPEAPIQSLSYRQPRSLPTSERWRGEPAPASPLAAGAWAPESRPEPVAAPADERVAAGTQPDASPRAAAESPATGDPVPKPATLARTPSPAAAPATGAMPLHGVLREVWYGIGGDGLADLKADSHFPAQPSGSEILSGLRLAGSAGENYGQRLRAYLAVSRAGAYAFRADGSGQSELRLVPAAGGRPLLALEGARAGSVRLAKGRYLVEVVQQRGAGADRGLEVTWKVPGSRAFAPIPGKVLSPAAD